MVNYKMEMWIMKRALMLGLLLCAAMFLVLGCGQEQTAEESETPKTESETAAETSQEETPMAKYSREEMEKITFAPGTKPRAEIETNFGTMILELWPEVAPLHCKNFVYLTQTGMYDSLNIFRLGANFMIQAGCPIGDGSGGPGYTIEGEFSDQKHVVGTLSMARSQDPNSAGSQFFICLAPYPSLDGKYTVFGKIVEGTEVLDQFNQAETKPNPTRGGENTLPVESLYLKISMLEG
jgi:peptidyl-prolyl cis-trans isomerase B (cyclophilin B)